MSKEQTQMKMQVLSAKPAKGRGPVGPKSLMGKNIAAKNSIKYGFFASKNLVIKGESEEELKLVRVQLLKHFDPKDTIEVVLVEQIIAHLWKLRRAQNLKSSLMNESVTVGLVEEISLDKDGQVSITNNRGLKFDEDKQNENWQNRFALFSRYAEYEQKAFYRTLHELQRIQGRKRGEKIPLPKCVDVNMMM